MIDGGREDESDVMSSERQRSGDALGGDSLIVGTDLGMG